MFSMLTNRKSTLLVCILLLQLSTFITLTTSRSCSQQSDCGGSDIRYRPCIDDKCSSCEVDNDCTNAHDDVCNNNGFCSLAGFFDPFSVTDFLATLVILLGAMIAAGGGLGGGGIFIPVYILILGMSTASAAALSQATIFGGSIVNLIMNFREQHPMRGHRPLPDLYTILIFEPMLLGGTIIGVIFNVILPEPLTLACLVVTLSYAAFRTLRKGIRIWKKETENAMSESLSNLEAASSDGDTPVTTDSNNNNSKKIEHKRKETETNNSRSNGLAVSDANSKSISEKNVEVDMNSDPTEDPTGSSEKTFLFLIQACGISPDDATKQSVINSVRKLIPLINEEKQIKRPLLIMLAMWTVVSIFSLLRRVVVQCSVGYWLLTLAVFPFLFFLSFYLSKKQVQNYQFKIEYGWVPCLGDIRWQNYRQALMYSGIAGIAGVLGGLLGIGGGMIISPLLLELQVLPRVASATSAMAVLVTSSSATLQFLLIDMLAIDYMMFFMAIGIIGTFMGQTIVNHCIRKYGRTSVVVLAIGTVIALAVLLMGLKGIIDIANGDSAMVFNSLC